MTPEISVIVPIYNVEPYLRRCVDSILGQDFEDFELILVDDGSPDGCPAICDEYAQKDGRVRVIHQPNAGLSCARNAGAALASAPRVTFVDADDYVSPRYLTALCAAAEGAGADIAAGRVCIETIQPGGQADRRPYPPPERAIMGRDEALAALFLEGTDGGLGGFAWGKLLPRQLVLEHPFPPGRLFEDSFTMWRLFLACQRVAYAPQAMYFYFQRSDSILRSPFSPRHMDLIDAVAEMAAAFQAQDLSPAVMNAGSFKVCRACYVTAYHAAELPYRQYLSVCRRVLPLLREHLSNARATGRLSGRDLALYRLLLGCRPLFYAAARLRG